MIISSPGLMLLDRLYESASMANRFEVAPARATSPTPCAFMIVCRHSMSNDLGQAAAQHKHTQFTGSREYAKSMLQI